MSLLRRFAPWALGCALFLCPALPAQQDGAAERLFVDAQRQEREGKPEEARQAYELLVERYPDTLQAETALLLLSDAYWQGGEGDRARKLLDKLTQDYPDSPNAAAAWVKQGQFQIETAANPEELEAARTPLRRVPVLFGPVEYPTLEARVEARVRSGEALLLLGQSDLAALAFLEAIEDESPSSWLPRALYGFAHSLFRGGDWAPAAESLQEVLNQEAMEEGLRQNASTDLGFIHRHWLRPALGQDRWARARAISVSGLTLKRPLHVDVSRDGRILIHDGGLGEVLLVSSDGELLERAAQPRAKDVAWSYDGVGFVATESGVVSIGASERQSFTGSAALQGIVSAQRGAFNEWFVLDKKVLWGFDRHQASRTLSAAGGDIVDITAGDASEVLLLDRKKEEVTVLGAGGETVRRISSIGRRPKALAVDVGGNVYILDQAQKTVEVRDRAGNKIASIGPNVGGIELRDPEDISVDGQGRLYIVDSRLAQVIVLE